MAGTFGEFVRYFRKKEGLTQQALGEAVGVDRTYINKIESGTVGLPQYELRTALGGVLGFSDDDLTQFGVHSNEPTDEEGYPIRVPGGLDIAIARLIEQTDERGRVVWSDQAVIIAVRALTALARIPFYDRESVVRGIEGAAANPASIAEAPGDYAVFPANSPAAKVLEILRSLPDEQAEWVLGTARFAERKARGETEEEDLTIHVGTRRRAG